MANKNLLLMIGLIAFNMTRITRCADSQPNTKDSTNCVYSCGNYIKLVSDNITQLSVEKINVKAVYTYAASNIKVSVLKREKYWIVNRRNFGTKPISYGQKTLLPNKEEAILWFRNKKCRIGPICAPNGDCWGDSAQTCYSDTTSDWVTSKPFHFKGIQWTMLLNDACTLDWECTYLEMDVPVHYNSEGKRFMIVDEEKVEIISQYPEQLFMFKNFALYVDKMPKEYEITKMLSCFKYLKELLCEDKNGAFILFEQGTKCTVLGNTKYCLAEGEFNKVRDFGANLYASVSDLNQVRDAFIVNQEKTNYNFYVINSKLKKLQEFSLKLVESISRKDPSVLDTYLKGKYFVRPLQNGVLEICNCKNPISCQTKEFHNTDLKFCSDGIRTKPLNPFSVSENLDFAIDEKFKFQGKPIHVEESILELEQKAGDFEESHPEKTWGGFGFDFGLSESINSVLTYIALVLSVINFFRR